MQLFKKFKSNNGQNDIDIFILRKNEEFKDFLLSLRPGDIYLVRTQSYVDFTLSKKQFSLSDLYGYLVISKPFLFKGKTATKHNGTGTAGPTIQIEFLKLFKPSVYKASKEPAKKDIFFLDYNIESPGIKYGAMLVGKILKGKNI